jgi:2-methylcitrate dehydratase PrpD
MAGAGTEEVTQIRRPMTQANSAGGDSSYWGTNDKAPLIGYDIARRAMDGGGGYQAFKERGWHSTSTCGGIGAAAAAGRLLGVNAQRLQWALGYAGSNAGGTWAYIPEGAMSKRVHPGFAATPASSRLIWRPTMSPTRRVFSKRRGAATIRRYTCNMNLPLRMAMTLISMLN